MEKFECGGGLIFFYCCDYDGVFQQYEVIVWDVFEELFIGWSDFDWQ